jgi:hypothetical protein
MIPCMLSWDGMPLPQEANDDDDDDDAVNDPKQGMSMSLQCCMCIPHKH